MSRRSAMKNRNNGYHPRQRLNNHGKPLISVIGIHFPINTLLTILKATTRSHRAKNAFSCISRRLRNSSREIRHAPPPQLFFFVRVCACTFGKTFSYSGGSQTILSSLRVRGRARERKKKKTYRVVRLIYALE